MSMNTENEPLLPLNEPENTNVTENNPMDINKAQSMPMMFETGYLLAKAKHSKKFLEETMEFTGMLIKLCYLLVEKIKYKSAKSILDESKNTALLSKIEIDIEKGIESVMFAFDKAVNTYLEVLKKNPIAYEMKRRAFQSARSIQVNECEILKSTTFTTQIDIKQFSDLFEKYKKTHVSDCETINVEVSVEINSMIKNVDDYIVNVHEFTETNPSLDLSSLMSEESVNNSFESEFDDVFSAE